MEDSSPPWPAVENGATTSILPWAVWVRCRSSLSSSHSSWHWHKELQRQMLLFFWVYWMINPSQKYAESKRNATSLKVTGSMEEMRLCGTSCDTAEPRVMGPTWSPEAVSSFNTKKYRNTSCNLLPVQCSTLINSNYNYYGMSSPLCHLLTFSSV